MFFEKVMVERKNACGKTPGSTPSFYDQPTTPIKKKHPKTNKNACEQIHHPSSWCVLVLDTICKAHGLSRYMEFLNTQFEKPLHDRDRI